MKNLLLALTLSAALAAPAMAQKTGDSMRPDPPVVKKCGAPAGPMAMMGFELLQDLPSAKAVSECLGKISVYSIEPMMIAYIPDVDRGYTYFAGAEMVQVATPASGGKYQIKLKFVGDASKPRKLVDIEVNQSAAPGQTFDRKEIETKLSSAFPGASFGQPPFLPGAGPVANKSSIVLTPALVRMTNAKLANLCLAWRQVKMCGPTIELKFGNVPGKPKKASFYTVRFTYGSKVFPAILASQQVDGTGKPLPAPAPTVAPPTAGKN